MGIDQYGPIGKVSLVHKDVKGNYSTKPSEETTPEWKKKLGEYQHSIAATRENAEESNSQNKGEQFKITNSDNAKKTDWSGIKFSIKK